MLTSFHVIVFSPYSLISHNKWAQISSLISNLFSQWEHRVFPTWEQTEALWVSEKLFTKLTHKWNQWCPTWAHSQPWILSFEPAPWGRLCGWLPFSSPKWREPDLGTWCHEEGKPSRRPSAWVSSSEGPSGPFAVNPWEEVCFCFWLCQSGVSRSEGETAPPS